MLFSSVLLHRRPSAAPHISQIKKPRWKYFPRQAAPFSGVRRISAFKWLRASSGNGLFAQFCILIVLCFAALGRAALLRLQFTSYTHKHLTVSINQIILLFFSFTRKALRLTTSSECVIKGKICMQWSLLRQFPTTSLVYSTSSFIEELRTVLASQ